MVRLPNLTFHWIIPLHLIRKYFNDFYAHPYMYLITLKILCSIIAPRPSKNYIEEGKTSSIAFSPEHNI